jgi:hypothetical protein
MSLDDPIEKQLSGIHLENYRRKCRAHPWYRESQRLIEEWNKKVAAKKEAGEDPATLFEDSYKLPVYEVIDFALAAQAQPDVWVYYVEQVEKLKKDPEAKANPEFGDISGPFQAWYFLHRGKPSQRDGLFAGHAIIHQFLRGELPSLDGPEARAYALSLPGTKA